MTKKTDNIELDGNGVSDLDIGFDFTNEPETTDTRYADQQVDDEEGLQRTEDWFLERSGSLTASVAKSLMSCSPKGGKMTWLDTLKIYEFSKGFTKLCYQKAMEQVHKSYIEQGKGTFDMQYGTAVEPLTQKYLKERIKIDPQFEGLTLKLVGYKPHPTIPNSGASSDALLVAANEKIAFTVEQKACTSWSSHYERLFESMDDKHIDFWQTQHQMDVWQTEKCVYVVASPPKNKAEYIFADDVMELYDKWIDECNVTVKIVDASPIHIEALRERLHILNAVTATWIASNLEMDLAVIKDTVIDEYRNAAMRKVSTKEPLTEKEIEEEENDGNALGLIDAVADYRKNHPDEEDEENDDENNNYPF